MKRLHKQGKHADFFASDKRNVWMLYAAFVLFNVILAVQYRAPFAYPDEYGVITAGNWMLGGVDWAYKSNMYYGYTFSPFVGVLLRLFNGIRPVYIGALCIKALQVSLIPALAYKLLHEVLDVEDARVKLLLSVTVSLYPSLTLYAKYVSNETTLHMTLFICLYLVGKLAVGQSKNITRLYSALLSFFAVFAYASHGMGLAFIAAVCLVVLVAHIGTQKKLVCYPFFIGSLAVSYLLDSKIKSIVMNAVYYKPPNSELTNTLSSVLDGLIGKLLNPGFVLPFFKMLMSRFLYISSSTFGMFLLMFIILLVHVFRFAKVRFTKGADPQGNVSFIVSIFSLAIFLCGIGISSLSNAPGSGDSSSRMYFYGRYYEYMALPLILTGLSYLFNRSIKKMELLKYFIVSFICYLSLYFYSHFLVMPYVSSSLNSFFILGILPFISNSNAGLGDISSQDMVYFDLFTLGLVAITTFVLTVYLLKGKRRSWALVLLSGMFVYGIVIGHTSVVLPLSVSNYNNFYSNMEPIVAALDEFNDIYKQYPKLYIVTSKLGAAESSSTLIKSRAQIAFADYSVTLAMNIKDLGRVADAAEGFKNAIIVSEQDLMYFSADDAYLKIYSASDANIWIQGDEIKTYYNGHERRRDAS